MAQITGGRVTYSRTVQARQYEPKVAEVELTFVLAEGEELKTTLDEVAKKARNKVLELVGLQTK